MDEADALCDRIAIIDNGEILVIDSTEALKNTVGNDVITLTVNDEEKLLPALHNLEWINNIEKHDSHLTIGVEKGEEKIPLLIEIAQKQQTTIKTISLRKPTLDDVFLHYTGRRIRDEHTSAQPFIPPRFRSR